MIKKIIKSGTKYVIGRNKIRVGATDARQFGDLLADILLLIPKRTAYGNVSWSMYQQAEEIFERDGKRLMNMPRISLSGHSLGGSVALLLALIMRAHGYIGRIDVRAYGSPKVLSKRARRSLYPLINYVAWRVRHRDIVCFLGGWKEPVHYIPREGCKRKHILDWDFTEHLMY